MPLAKSILIALWAVQPCCHSHHDHHDDGSVNPTSYLMHLQRFAHKPLPYTDMISENILVSKLKYSLYRRIPLTPIGPGNPCGPENGGRDIVHMFCVPEKTHEGLEGIDGNVIRIT